MEEVQVKPNVYQRILAIMGELDYIEKGSAKVNNQYRFVSHDQVTAKIHPLLVKHGVVIVPTIEEIKQNGNRTEVKLLVVFVNVDVPQDQFFVRSVGYGIDGGQDKNGISRDGDKGPGKAVSYAFKYAILKTFCLETGDDPDNNANAVYEPPKCLEFDAALPLDMNKKTHEKLTLFLEDCAKVMNKHVEDVKREALTRLPEFLKAFKNWSSKKKGEE